MNHQIRVPMIRVIKEGQPLGVMSTKQAMEIAMNEDLDLVEIVPNANPPVCHIVDLGKFKYEEKIKQKAERAKNKSVASKEIHLRPCTGDHDIETKAKSLRNFLEERRNVRVVVKFKNRELAFKSHGEEVIKKVIAAVSEVGRQEGPFRMEGKNLVANIVPLKTDK